MEEQKDFRPIILAAFALLAIVIVGVILISRSGGGSDFYFLIPKYAAELRLAAAGDAGHG